MVMKGLAAEIVLVSERTTNRIHCKNVNLTVIMITAILMLMPPHIIGKSSTPLAFAQNYTSTCSLGRTGTCFATGHADGLNNPNSQCLPDNNMDSTQVADYCSGFYSAHRLGAQNNPTSNSGQGVNQPIKECICGGIESECDINGTICENHGD
jgi:hypothetical protein